MKNSFSESGREEPVSETVVCKRCRGAAISDACPECGRPGNATPTADGIAPVRSRHPGETPRPAVSTEVLAAATKLRPSRTAMKPVLPVQLASRFEVLGVLGRGGAGYVLHARDRMIGREVAIKLLAEGFMDPTAVLQTEATHLAGLEHDRIVRLYEFGRAGDAPYLVMELVRGQTLWSLLTRERPPILEALGIGADVAEGLRAAHKHGIVHRDIKPQNIFLDQEGRAKIADFGVARTAEADEAKGDEEQPDAGITGTPGYLAPEQARGRAATPATDVYALGVVLHEILAGERLFTGHSILSILAAQKRGPERKPSAANPGVPAGVDELVMRCLAGDPAQRPSAGEVAEELRGWRERLARALRQPSAAGFPEHPYKLLDHFDVTDGQIYFGRDAEVAELAALLDAPSLRQLLVFGPCGIGKSSLLRAGLVRALDPAAYAARVLISGADPAGAIESALEQMADAAGVAADEIVHGTAAGARACELAIAISSRTKRTPVLVVDQLEELFTLNAPDAPAIARFFELACGVCEEPGVPIRLVLAFRTEFRGQFFELERRLARVSQSYGLRPMREADLAEAIAGPTAIEVYGFAYEPLFPLRLARDLVAAVDGRLESATPVLQIVCRQLYDRAKSDGVKVIGPATYEKALGGARGALQRYVENRLSGPGYAGRAALARQMLRALTVRGEGGERYARAREQEDLLDFPDRAAARRTLDQLLADRLVVLGEPSGGQRTVRLSSEVICPLVDAWTPDVDEAERAARLLARTARQWHENGRRPEDLLTGGALALVLRQLSALREVDAKERELLDASLSARTQRRALTALAAVALAAVAAFAAWTVWLRPGRVHVVSDPPGADVFQGEARLGRTPLSFSSRPGVRQLSLKRAPYQDLLLTVRVPAGGEVSYEPVLAYPFGMLAVSTDPAGARCQVKSSGGATVLTTTTPFHAELPSGQYSLELAHRACEPESVGTIAVPANRALVERLVKLRPNTGWLRVESPTPGARLTVRDAATGQVALTATLPMPPRELGAGTYVLEAGQVGHHHIQRSVRVTRGTTETVTAYTPALPVLWRSKLDKEAYPLAAVDVNGDGPTEVVNATGGSLTILDGVDGTVKATIDVHGPESRSDYRFAKAFPRKGRGPVLMLQDASGAVKVVDLRERKVVLDLPGGDEHANEGHMGGDIDGDGALDILRSGRARDGQPLLNAIGAGGKLLWQYLLEADPVAFDAVDLDGDGADEALIATNDGRLTVVGRDGKQRWMRQEQMTRSAEVAALATVDANQDGKREVVWAIPGATIALDFDGKPIWVGAGHAGAHLAAGGDVDGDGKPDVVAASDRGLSVMDARTGKVRWTSPERRAVNGVQLGDADGDGLLDIALDQRDSLLTVLSGRDGRLLWEVSAEMSLSGRQIVADLDGDRLIDAATVDGEGKLNAYRCRPDPAMWAFRLDGDGDSLPMMVDLNRDGVLDAVMFATRGRTGTVHAVDGASGRELFRTIGDSTGESVMTVGDLNRDGTPDLVASAGRDGLAVISGVDGHVLWSRRAGVMGLSGAEVVDADGDGQPDIAVTGNLAVDDMQMVRVAMYRGSDGQPMWMSDPIADLLVGAPALAYGAGKPVGVWASMLDSVPEDADVPPDAPATVGWFGLRDGKFHPVGLDKLDESLRVTGYRSTNLDGDGTPDVLVTQGFYGAIAYSGKTGKRLWAVDGSKQGPDTISHPEGFCADDLDGNGTCDVLLMESDETLVAHGGADGKPLWKARVGEAPVHTLFMYPIDGDAVPDVICSVKDGTLRVISGRTGRIVGDLRMKGNVRGGLFIYDPKSKAPITVATRRQGPAPRRPAAGALVIHMPDQQTVVATPLDKVLPK